MAFSGSVIESELAFEALDRIVDSDNSFLIKGILVWRITVESGP